ncbi:glycosyltransferase family 39 protein [Allomuricauda sp. d1]|uniref:ArnT family glycosyltransferase n=1 Tax=Allomuricauda sp. d1 TaxID=3136725 RepID=UPI0031D812D9
MAQVLKKIADYLTPNYQKLKTSTVFFWFFSCALFIRFPFFFRDYIDRDESTFIIMAQSWVDGHLPYTQLWDLKPPIIFLFFAILIKLFGKSFIAIRLAGTLMVAITAICTYKIANRTTSTKVAFWVGIFTVIFQSLFGSLQGVMSEHICITFFMVGLYTFLFKPQWYFVLLSGVFFGLSLMSKLNVAYPIFFLVIYLTWEAFRQKRLPAAIQKLFWLGFGILIVITMTALPYYLSGETMLWWQSVFMAPMAYSSSKPATIIKVVLFFLLFSVWVLFSFKKGWLDFKKREAKILVVISFGIVFSFLQTGKINGHYLILIYPPLLLLIELSVSKIGWLKKLNRPSILLIVFLLLPMEAYLEYYNIIKNKVQNDTFFNGEGINVPKYIIGNQIDTKNILFFEYHIGYWLLNEEPPTKAATHPSTILRESMFPYMQNPRKTSMEELRYLMEKVRPPIVVTRRNRRVFDKKMEEANAYINAYLEENYQKLDSVDAALIHQRLE